MARIPGVNIPNNKRVHIALTYIHGIGDTRAKEIVEKVGITEERRVQDLSDAEVLRLREAIDEGYTVEGDLVKMNANGQFVFKLSADKKELIPADDFTKEWGASEPYILDLDAKITC